LVLQQFFGLGESQADGLHALDGEEATEAREERRPPAESRELPTDVPQAGVVLEQIGVCLAKVQVVYHVRVVAVEQVLQVLHGQLLIIGIADLLDAEVEQRLVVVKVAGNGVQDVAQKGGAGAPRGDHHTAHRGAVRLRRHVRQSLGTAARILEVLHFGQDARPLSRQDIHYSSCQVVDDCGLLLLQLLLEAIVEGAARQRIGGTSIHGRAQSAATLIPAIRLVKRGGQRTVLRGGDQQQDAQTAHAADADQIGPARHPAASPLPVQAEALLSACPAGIDVRRVLLAEQGARLQVRTQFQVLVRVFRVLRAHWSLADGWRLIFLAAFAGFSC